VADPLLAAARSTLDGSLIELRKQLDGLDAEALNARPGGAGTNPLAVIAVHALASAESWLALATQAPLPPRDRPAEFRTVVDDGDAFLAKVDKMASTCRMLLMDAHAIDLAWTGTAPWRTGPDADALVTAGWALLHALDHLREHIGHAQLTRQLLRPAGEA
jgi:hypothetical protein